MLAGGGAAYHLAVAAAFVHALHPATRARAFGMARPGLCAVQGPGILADGAVARRRSEPHSPSGLSGLVGLTAATVLAKSWNHLHAGLIRAQRAEVETTGA